MNNNFSAQNISTTSKSFTFNSFYLPPCPNYLTIRPATRDDLSALYGLVDTIDEFNKEEKQVACEVLSEALTKQDSTYQVIVAYHVDVLSGYIGFGRTPMTCASYDIYWLAVQKNYRGQKIASYLLSRCESILLQAQAHVVRIETSNRVGYEGTIKFYLNHGYTHISTICGFYGPDDDLISMIKYCS